LNHAAWTAASGRGEGRWPLELGVRADARRAGRQFPRAIEASPRARKTFQSLGRQNLYALAFRTTNMKTPAGRARKMAALVDMLERGETPYPERR
jgi:uncharacterized protein YdeI (YjbR/CyaY-like superfamily)